MIYPPKSIDLILCDPPYGTTDCKWDTVLPIDRMWEQYKRIIKDNGAIVLFSAQPFTTVLINSNLKQYRYNWYWKKNNKTGFTFAKYQPMRCIEDICVFYKKAPVYNPQGLMAVENPKVRQYKNVGKDTVYRMDTLRKPHTSKYTNYPVQLLEFAKDPKTVHPTQKPVALLEYLIKTYTNEGDVVLDNCMGSGSTGVACVNTGRRFIGMELANTYFEIAEQRINNAIN